MQFLKNSLFGLLMLVAVFALNLANLQAASTWQTVTASVREVDPASNELVVGLPNDETGAVRILRFEIHSDTKWVGLGGLRDLKENSKVQVDFHQEKGGVFAVSRLKVLPEPEQTPRSSSDEEAAVSQ